MLATPLRVRDLIVGHQLYVACRLAVVGGIYLVILAVFGVLHSPLAILALPSVVLVGLAYSGPVSAFSAWLERDGGFNALFRFGVIPMSSSRGRSFRRPGCRIRFARLRTQRRSGTAST
jgi:lipooligosaccharide transport system permease protein